MKILFLSTLLVLICLAGFSQNNATLALVDGQDEFQPLSFVHFNEELYAKPASYTIDLRLHANGDNLNFTLHLSLIDSANSSTVFTPSFSFEDFIATDSVRVFKRGKVIWMKRYGIDPDIYDWSNLEANALINNGLRLRNTGKTLMITGGVVAGIGLVILPLLAIASVAEAILTLDSGALESTSIIAIATGGIFLTFEISGMIASLKANKKLKEAKALLVTP